MGRQEFTGPILPREGQARRAKAGLIVLIFTLIAGAGASPARAGWVVQTSGTANDLRSVHFPVDATTGYAVGVAGTILKTTDGGATSWVAQTSGTANELRSVHFPVDATTGYAVGIAGTILKTTDGGANWVPQTSGTANDLRSVYFPVDATTGYTVGVAGTILKTIDGGANWVPQTSGTVENLRSVHFPVDATTGYAVGNAGTILKTTDGGATPWVAQTSGTGQLLRGVHFPADATTGYAVGGAGTILKTTDGGATPWVAQTSGTAEELRGVHFPANATTGYAVGRVGTIVKTNDGGATSWVAQNSRTTEHLRGVHFPVDASTGYAVGNAGTILKLILYAFRKPVTIDRGQIADGSCGATLANYPMLFNSVDPDLRNTGFGGGVTDLGGDDIIFEAFDATTCGGPSHCVLDHEIERYNLTTGEFVAWVRLPSVNTAAAGSDTVIYLTYGNGTVTSPTENPTGVWDSSFVGVWHLEENVTDDTSGGTHEDSTSNAHHGTQTDNGPTPAIAFGQEFDGAGDTITVPDDDTLSLDPNDPVTVSAWIFTNTASTNMILAKEDASVGEWEFYIRTTGNLTLTLLDGDGTNWLGRDTDAPFPTGGWHHVAATHDGSGTTGGITLYLDGAVAPSSAYTGGSYVAMDNTTAPVGIGAYDGGGNIYDMDGRIDEVRFSNTTRTGCWIGAEFNNHAWPDKSETPTLGPSPNPNEGFYGIGPPVATSVDLVSFTASGVDGGVDLRWRTGSELNNLGFHLYRSLSPGGLWTRVTPSLIPGLGSSPEGASYSFRDTGLGNGTTYLYKLEDIDSTSGSTFHGPVSATPSESAEEDDDEGEGEAEGEDGGETPGETTPERTSYGSPGKPQLRVLSRNTRAMVVELTTPGFVATDTSAGVRVSVRGFDARRHPEAPALPLKRALVNGVVGRHARIVWAREKQVSSFPDLVPAAVGSPEVFVGSDGTVLPRRREMEFAPVDGVHPLSAAWIAGDAFIRKKKKLALELNPLRYDAASRTLRLARKLQVKIAFDRQARVPEDGSGSQGVRLPSSSTSAGGHVLAYLHTLEKGLHAVPYAALGLQGPVAQKSLRLSLQGQTVPHRIEPASKKHIGPGSVLYFYAAHEASSVDHSSETTYALERGPGGVVMGQAAGSLKGLRPVATAPLSEARFEANRFYQAGLLDAPDIWLWDFVVGGTSKSFPFALPGLDASSPEPVQLQLRLQGASEAEAEGEHHLSVSVNGVPVGETTFDGKLPHVFTTPVPVAALVNGENSLQVTNLGDTGAYSFVFLDRFSVVHPRTRTLEKGRFDGVFAQKGRASLPGAARYGVDVTDPGSPKWVKLHKTRAKRTFKALAGHRYVVASRGGLLSPRVTRPLETGLWESWNQADYVLIAPAAYLEAAGPLLERREGQGLRVKAVSFEEIVSQFGYGRPSAQAIRDFLAHAYHHWEAPRLQYVLLLGDASYDPRNFTGLSKGSPLPAMWAKTSYLVTSSDPLMGAVNGEDGLTDVAIGRLPATTVEEAEALVRKVLDWEDGSLDLGGKAILVADNPDIAGDFEWDIQDIRTSFLQGRETQTIHLRDHGANTRTEVLSALDQGASLLSYVGHGGPAVWASENVLNSWDAPSLLAQPEQPLMLTFNCLNGYFVAPNYDSLAEAFMKEEGRGTIGAFSPSGLSLDGPAHRFHRAFMEEIANGGHERLGDAVLAAQGAYAETGIMPELLAVYHLFADPGMRIR